MLNHREVKYCNRNAKQNTLPILIALSLSLRWQCILSSRCDVVVGLQGTLIDGGLRSSTLSQFHMAHSSPDTKETGNRSENVIHCTCMLVDHGRYLLFTPRHAGSLELLIGTYIDS